MVRRISPAQARSKLRQMENKQRQAVRKYNQAANKHNQKVKQAVNTLNRDIRAHNTRVRQNRQRLKNALASLQRAPIVQSYSVIRTSTLNLNAAYSSLERQVDFDDTDHRYRLMLELPQQETANSLAVTGALLGEVPAESEHPASLQETAITDELAAISPDLHQRWHGALYALNPQNPDSTRHFCTSAREIFTYIFDIKAPDDAVFSALPGCATTEHGTPTRRSKIYYFLQNQALQNEALGTFIDQDIDNVLELFGVFNAGTHGPAGRLEFEQLILLKKRVEDALIFLTGIAG